MVVIINQSRRLLLIAIYSLFLVNRTDALNCYFCSSSSSIYNEDCQNGTAALRFGPCPSGYNYCIARYVEYPDGSNNILRDCSKNNEPPLFNATTGVQIHCGFDLCNGGYLGSSTPNTTSTTANPFNPSSSASRVLSWCNWSFAVALYVLGSFVLFMDSYPNVIYQL